MPSPRKGVSCKAGKVKAVKNWPVPTTTAFLGFASYYLVATGNDHKKKKGADISKLWNQKHQHAFNELKTALTTAPALGSAQFTEPFILETDASHDGLSAILSGSRWTATGPSLRKPTTASHREEPGQLL